LDAAVAAPTATYCRWPTGLALMDVSSIRREPGIPAMRRRAALEAACHEIIRARLIGLERRVSGMQQGLASTARSAE
jgi:hypothetical protein